MTNTNVQIHGNEITMELNFYLLAFQTKKMNFAFSFREERNRNFVVWFFFFFLNKKNFKYDPTDFKTIRSTD